MRHGQVRSLIVKLCVLESARLSAPCANPPHHPVSRYSAASIPAFTHRILLTVVLSRGCRSPLRVTYITIRTHSKTFI